MVLPRMIVLVAVLSGFAGSMCPAVITTPSFPVVKSWKDIETHIAPGERIVSIVPGSMFNIQGTATLTRDKSSLTGWSAIMPARGEWFIQWYPANMTPNPVALEKEHTLYLLVRAKRKSADKLLFHCGIYPNPQKKAELNVPAEVVRENTWYLMKVGRFVLRDDGLLFIDQASAKELAVGGLILASDYEPQIYIGEYLTPNGDGLNDEVKILQPVRIGTHVKVEILDRKKQVVKAFAEQTLETPFFDLSWDGGTNDGQQAPAGKYSVRTTQNGRAAVYSDSIFLQRPAPLKKVHYAAGENFFPFGVYLDGTNDKSIPDDPAKAADWYDRRFKQLADGGFNFIAVVWQKSGHAELIFKTAQKYGIKVAMTFGLFGEVVGPMLTEEKALHSASAVAREYKQFPSLHSYIISDEPQFNKVDNWLTMQRAMYTIDPDHPVFTCFNNRAMIERVLQSSVLHHIMADVYVFFGGASREQALERLGPEIRHLVEVDPGRPAWVILQAFGGQGARFPTVEDLRVSTWLTLAEGAKGIVYFVYGDIPGAAPMQGMVDGTGKATPVFTEAALIGQTLRKIAPVLVKLKPTQLGIKINFGHTLGQFVDEDKHPYVIAVNRNVEKESQAIITVPADPAVKKAVDAATGRSWPVTQRRIVLPLRRAEGVLLRLE